MHSLHVQRKIAISYQQLALDLRDWPLVCIKVEGCYFTDISLPFGLRWAAAACQDVTSLIVRDLASKGLHLLS